MIWRDLRYAIRTLIRSPGFFAVAFVAIALGIGVNTTILGIVNTLAPSPAPDRTFGSSACKSSPPILISPGAIRIRISIFSITRSRTASSPEWPVTALPAIGMTRGGETSNVLGQTGQRKLLRSARAAAISGTRISPGGRYRAERASRRRSQLQVLEKTRRRSTTSLASTMTLNGRAFTVIGVAPPGFTGIDIGRGAGDLDAAGDAQLDPAFR